MDRAQKAESIESLKGVFAEAGSVVVTHNLGLTVAEMEDLRGRLRKEGGAFKVVKNRLALKALEAEEGSDYHNLFKGPVGIAYSENPGTAAKVATEFAKGNDRFKIVGGARRGSRSTHRPAQCACDPYRRRAASTRRSAGSRVQRLRHQGSRVSGPAFHLCITL